MPQAVGAKRKRTTKAKAEPPCEKKLKTDLITQALARKQQLLQRLLNTTTDPNNKSLMEAELKATKFLTAQPDPSQRARDIQVEHDRLARLGAFLEKQPVQTLDLAGFASVDFKLERPGHALVSTHLESTRRQLLHMQRRMFDVRGNRSLPQPTKEQLAKPATGKKRVLLMARAGAGGSRLVEVDHSLQATKNLIQKSPESLEVEHRIKEMLRWMMYQHNPKGVDNLGQSHETCRKCAVELINLSRERFFIFFYVLLLWCDSSLICLLCTARQSSAQPSGSNPFETEPDYAKKHNEKDKDYFEFVYQYHEGVVIPQRVYDLIVAEFAKRFHVFSATEVKNAKAKKIMEDVGLKDYLPFLTRICMHLKDQKIPSFTMEHIRLLVKLNVIERTLYVYLAADHFPNKKAVTKFNCELLGLFEQAACFKKKTNEKQDPILTIIAELMGRAHKPRPEG